jgi:hypothetical protein
LVGLLATAEQEREADHNGVPCYRLSSPHVRSSFWIGFSRTLAAFHLS